MSSFFKDDEYENMEEFTKLVRPMLWSKHDSFAQFPDVVELSYEDIEKYFGRRMGIYNITMDQSMSFFNDRHSLDEFSDYFHIIIADGTEINVNDKKIDGSISLHKKTPSLSDAEMLIKLSKKIDDNFQYDLTGAGTSQRIGEIAEVFDIKINSKKKRDRANELRTGICEQIVNNRLKIFSGDLIVNMSIWINDYLSNGDLRSFANINKLKVMTIKGEPIYSMKEI